MIIMIPPIFLHPRARLDTLRRLGLLATTGSPWRGQRRPLRAVDGGLVACNERGPRERKEREENFYECHVPRWLSPFIMNDVDCSDHQVPERTKQSPGGAAGAPPPWQLVGALKHGQGRGQASWNGTFVNSSSPLTSRLRKDQTGNTDKGLASRLSRSFTSVCHDENMK